MNSLIKLPIPLLALVIFVGWRGTSEAQLLLRDDFDGAGIVDPSVWRLPFDSEGTFVGRTQFRGDAAIDMPLQGVAEAAASDGLVAELHLDTFSPIDAGNQFLGTDLLTKGNFGRGGGVSFEARMRLKPTTSAGLVNGFFLFDVTRDSPPGANNLVRDEIDWELLGNQAVGGGQDPATNFWNEGPFAGPGSGGDLQFHNISGLDLTQFQDYRIDWTPSAVRWYVNDALVRTQTTDIPDDPMNLHFNIWAADEGFAAAYDASLQPTAVEGSNERFTVQVDHVEVNRINTEVSANLLTNPSFETGDFTGWNQFGNVFNEEDDVLGVSNSIPDTAPDGFRMAKMFNPFFTPGAASGVIQSVPASPGEEFEARVEVSTTTGDSMLGTENFNLLVLRFLDGAGEIITEAFADPGNQVDSNGQSFPLLDGRDPLAENDLFYEGVVNAVAPAGTASVEYGLFFISLAFEGGAAWYDNASLVRLTALAPPAIQGDFNNDGVVDVADYTVWRDNLGGDESTINGNGDGMNGVDIEDYLLWRTNFGQVAGAGALASGAVPEPAGCLLLALGVAGAAATRRRC